MTDLLSGMCVSCLWWEDGEFDKKVEPVGYGGGGSLMIV